jgi:general stress protein 26
MPRFGEPQRSETIPVQAEWLEAGEKPLVLSIPYVPAPAGIPQFGRPRAPKAPPPLPPGHSSAKSEKEAHQRSARPSKAPEKTRAHAMPPGKLDARSELLAFLRGHRLCVQASVSSSGAPQSAVVGFAVSDDLEIVFDTLATTRKVHNLRRDAHVSLVVGWDDEQTAQIEGTADEPKGSELHRLKTVYFAAWPDGVERESWKNITYVRVRPTWARFSDFRGSRPAVEWNEADLGLAP